jgi:hypothetical protein
MPSVQRLILLGDVRMKTYIASLCFCLLLMSGSSLSSANARENPLFDRYHTKGFSFKAEKARLNNYAVQLQNAPGSRGLIVVYAESEGAAKSAQARARRAMRYLVRGRGISAERLAWRYERPCGREQILLYLFYPDEADPAPDLKCIQA